MYRQNYFLEQLATLVFIIDYTNRTETFFLLGTFFFKLSIFQMSIYSSKVVYVD